LFSLWQIAVDGFGQAQQFLFEQIAQPVLYATGQTGVIEEAYYGTGLFLAGCLQVAFLALVLAPLQRLRPAEPVTDRCAVRVDIGYTLLHRLGLFQLVLFFTLHPMFDSTFSDLRVRGFATFDIDAPLGLHDSGVASFLLYLLVLDGLGYWIHRAQHRFEWWWALHSLHHSQRQMTVWSDDRNHLLDDLLRDAILAVTAWLIGVGPGQFIGIICVTQLLQSLQHANLRLWFGNIGERLLVSPRFHRMHHAVGIGHEGRLGKGTLGGCNFGVLFPLWDIFFRTANFDLAYPATGIRDQVETGRDYGQGFWRQQWLGLRRLIGARSC